MEGKSTGQFLQQSGHKPLALYRFISLCGVMIKSVCYVPGKPVTAAELRALMDIRNSPGIISVDLCRAWNRSRGAVSHIVKSLEEKELVYRCGKEHSQKEFGFYLTGLGQKVLEEFIREDLQDETHLISRLLEHCTPEELTAFYKVIECYTQVLLEHPDSRWRSPVQQSEETQDTTCVS